MTDDPREKRLTGKIRPRRTVDLRARRSRAAREPTTDHETKTAEKPTPGPDQSQPTKPQKAAAPPSEAPARPPEPKPATGQHTRPAPKRPQSTTRPKTGIADKKWERPTSPPVTYPDGKKAPRSAARTSQDTPPEQARHAKKGGAAPRSSTPKKTRAAPKTTTKPRQRRAQHAPARKHPPARPASRAPAARRKPARGRGRPQDAPNIKRIAPGESTVKIPIQRRQAPPPKSRLPRHEWHIFELASRAPKRTARPTKDAHPTTAPHGTTTAAQTSTEAPAPRAPTEPLQREERPDGTDRWDIDEEDFELAESQGCHEEGPDPPPGMMYSTTHIIRHDEAPRAPRTTTARATDKETTTTSPHDDDLPHFAAPRQPAATAQGTDTEAIAKAVAVAVTEALEARGPRPAPDTESISALVQQATRATHAPDDHGKTSGQGTGKGKSRDKDDTDGTGQNRELIAIIERITQEAQQARDEAQQARAAAERIRIEGTQIPQALIDQLAEREADLARRERHLKATTSKSAKVASERASGEEEPTATLRDTTRLTEELGKLAEAIVQASRTAPATPAAPPTQAPAWPTPATSPAETGATSEHAPAHGEAPSTQSEAAPAHDAGPARTAPSPTPPRRVRSALPEGEVVCPACEEVVFLTPDIEDRCPFCEGDLNAPAQGLHHVDDLDAAAPAPPETEDGNKQDDDTSAHGDASPAASGPQPTPAAAGTAGEAAGWPTASKDDERPDAAQGRPTGSGAGPGAGDGDSKGGDGSRGADGDSGAGGSGGTRPVPDPMAEIYRHEAPAALRSIAPEDEDHYLPGGQSRLEQILSDPADASKDRLGAGEVSTMAHAFRATALAQSQVPYADIDRAFLQDPSRPITSVPRLPDDSPFEEMLVYSIESPYSYVRILRDRTTRKIVYDVIEPKLSDDEQAKLDFIDDTLVKTLDLSYDELEKSDTKEYLRQKIDAIIRDYDIRLTTTGKERVQYFLYRRYIGYGKIHVLMLDPTIEDVSCDGPEIPVFIFHRTEGSLETSVKFNDDEELDSFVLNLAQKSGRHISVADPLLDATLPDGSRLQASIGADVTTRGSTFTIRRFRPEPITPPEIVQFGTLSEGVLAYSWLAVQYGRSVVIAGGTASGKTTTLNAASLFVSPSAKVVSIEDTRELNLSHDNWIPGVTRAGTGEMVGSKEAGSVTMFDLLRAALRQRPEYIILGEIRGEEANVLFQAMATGHTVFSTMHADSVQSVVHRLESKPLNIPRILLSALDIVLVQAQVRIRGRRARRVESITEIVGLDADTDEILTNEVFVWDIPNDRFVFTGKSQILDEIQKTNNWTREELEDQAEQRVTLLRRMRQNGWTDFRAVNRLIHAFFEDPQMSMDLASTPRDEAPADHPLVVAGRTQFDEGHPDELPEDEALTQAARHLAELNEGDHGYSEAVRDLSTASERQRAARAIDKIGAPQPAKPRHDGPGDTPTAERTDQHPNVQTADQNQDRPGPTTPEQETQDSSGPNIANADAEGSEEPTDKRKRTADDAEQETPTGSGNDEDDGA